LIQLILPPAFVDVDATVNIFLSNTCPTTIDVDEISIMAVVILLRKI
jgi:hypothetical protein